MRVVIQVAKQFSRYPAGRNFADGPASGELFRTKFLEPAFKNPNGQIVVELDGVRGYGSSFLEEAFGGLIRSGISADQVHRFLLIETADASLKQEILEYIADAEKELHKA